VGVRVGDFLLDFRDADTRARAPSGRVLLKFCEDTRVQIVEATRLPWCSVAWTIWVVGTTNIGRPRGHTGGADGASPGRASLGCRRKWRSRRAGVQGHFRPVSGRRLNALGALTATSRVCPRSARWQVPPGDGSMWMLLAYGRRTIRPVGLLLASRRLASVLGESQTWM